VIATGSFGAVFRAFRGPQAILPHQRRSVFEMQESARAVSRGDSGRCDGLELAQAMSRLGSTRFFDHGDTLGGAQDFRRAGPLVDIHRGRSFRFHLGVDVNVEKLDVACNCPWSGAPAQRAFDRVLVGPAVRLPF